MPYTKRKVDPQDKVRVDFADGNWWEVLSYLPHGVERRWLKAVAKILDEDKSSVPADEQAVVMDAVRQIKLLGCTVAWSWDDEPTEEAIDERRSDYVHMVVQKMDELYRRRDEDTERNLETETSR